MDRGSGKLLLNNRASEPTPAESERSSLSDAPLSRSQIQRPSKLTASPWNPGHVSPQHQPRPTMRRKLKLPSRPKHKQVLKLPRMDEVIPRVELSGKQQADMREEAEAFIQSCLLKSKAAWDGTKQIFDDPKQWKLHSAKPHLAVYKRKDPRHSSATAHQFVASGRIPGLTLQDVEYGKYSDTTLDERSVNAYLFRDYFLDAAVLQVLETQTDEDPFRFFGIKWMAFASPSGPARFFSPRDHAYYEYAKSVTTEEGYKVLVKVMQSVGDDVVPPLTQLGHDKHSEGVDASKLRFVRGRISMISMYKFDEATNAVRVFSEGSLDPGGRAGSWLSSAFLSQFAPTVVRIEYCADIKYIMKHGMVFPHPPVAPSHSQSAQSLDKSQSSMSEVTAHGPPLSASHHGVASGAIAPSADMPRMSINPQPSWVPDYQRKVCFVCFKSFGIVRRHRHHCRMCGEVMCSRCMIVLPLVPPPSSAPCPNDEAQGNAGDDEPRHSHRLRPTEGRPLSVLLKQPAKKSLEETRPNGYPAVNNVKLCKKCMFNIRQERKGTMRGATNFYAAPTMIKQFPLVLQGSLADNVGLRPGPMRGFFPGGRYAADDELNNNAGGGDGLEEDDVEETDEEYSTRVEHMRQMHMAREKKKNLRRSILLYDEDGISNGEESPPARPSHLFHGGNTTFNFDDFLLPTPKRNEDGEDGVRFSGRGRVVSSTNQSEALPLSAPRRASTAARRSESSSKLRSLSIPDQLEQVERSIAQQEALIRSIAEQRSKMIRSPEDDTVAKTTAATTAGEMSSEARSSLLYPPSTQTAPTPRADALFTPLSMRST